MPNGNADFSPIEAHLTPRTLEVRKEGATKSGGKSAFPGGVERY